MTKDKPTELTEEDIDKFIRDLNSGIYDIKQRPCFTCGKDHFPNYGFYLLECDECYFSRLSKKDVKAFYRSILKNL